MNAIYTQGCQHHPDSGRLHRPTPREWFVGCCQHHPDSGRLHQIELCSCHKSRLVPGLLVTRDDTSRKNPFCQRAISSSDHLFYFWPGNANGWTSRARLIPANCISSLAICMILPVPFSTTLLWPIVVLLARASYIMAFTRVARSPLEYSPVAATASARDDSVAGLAWSCARSVAAAPSWRLR